MATPDPDDIAGCEAYEGCRGGACVCTDEPDEPDSDSPHLPTKGIA